MRIQKVQTPFPARLRAWRAAKGLSREQAASLFGVSLKTLEAWELGVRIKNATTIIAIIERLIDDGF